ncbi:MAG: adenylate/guanylate cyclase domain-containing protein [Nitrososphaerales archaeon]
MTLTGKADEAVIERIRARVSQTLQKGLQFETSTELSEKFLRRHVNNRVKLVILYADIEGSTRMSLTLPTQVLASIVQVFSQEMTMLTVGYGGYVLKYVGDALISFFPGEFDSRKACNNAVNCAHSMMKVVAEGLNTAFNDNGLPTIGIKVGIDFGDNLVVLYGRDPAKSYIDIVGSSISVAAKITAVASPGQIMIGQYVYELLDYELQKEFVEYKPSADIWTFKDPRNGTLYRLYSTI